MSQNPFDPNFKDLPDILPIFPLDGVVLLPRGDLPLNVFEPRYMGMVDDVFKTNRMIGIVQPMAELSVPQSALRATITHERGQNPHLQDDAGAPDTADSPAMTNLMIDEHEPLYHIGCAGRITHFAELEEGRYLITLRGICRFRVREDEGEGATSSLKTAPLKEDTPYRLIQPDWSGFEDDLKKIECPPIDRKQLCGLLQRYFAIHEITLDWSLLHNIEDDEMLMTALAMICPFSSMEKQALLESPCTTSRLSLLISLLEMSAYYTAQVSHIKRH